MASRIVAIVEHPIDDGEEPSSGRRSRTHDPDLPRLELDA
jgi:hypothetical protein